VAAGICAVSGGAMRGRVNGERTEGGSRAIAIRAGGAVKAAGPLLSLAALLLPIQFAA